MKIYNPSPLEIYSKFVTKINMSNAGVAGQLYNINTFFSLEELIVNNNLLSGSFPDLSSLVKLWNFQCHSNRLSGEISNLSNLGELIFLICYNNEFSGTIPVLQGSSKLKTFHFGNNKLTGGFPLWQNLPSLEEIHLYTNLLSDNISSLGNLPKLKRANFSWNNFEGVSQDFSVSNVLLNFEARGNNLAVDSVDKILTAFDSVGGSGGSLMLDLGGNATPSAVGLSAKSNLLNKGWNVVSN